MAARTTRQEAWARLRAAFEKAMDKVIPEDPALPLRGRTFAELEDQADAFDQAVTGTLIFPRKKCSGSCHAHAPAGAVVVR